MKKTQEIRQRFIKNTSLSFSGTQKTICILLAYTILLSGCASTTLFKTSPNSADIYINEQKAGITPYSYTDRKAAGASTSISFQKDGYKDLYINLKRNEQLAVGALIGGIWLLVPLFWIKKYNPVHYYEMEKVESDKLLISALDTAQYRADDLETKEREDIEKTVSKADSTFKDSRDGYTYKIVKIGNQIWLAENLRYLPQVNIPSDISRKEPRYYVNGSSWSNTDSAKQENNYKIFGVLYNWSAACKSCPKGWHLPSDNEWKELEMYLGMTQTDADLNTSDAWESRGYEEGSKLKASNGWENYESVLKKSEKNLPKNQRKDTVTLSGNGTDEFGFSALPGGYIGYKGEFMPTGYGGLWWTSTPFEFHVAFSRQLNSARSSIIRSYRTSRKAGSSVRCVKDQ